MSLPYFAEVALRNTLNDRITRTMAVLEGALQSAQTVAAISTILCAQQNRAAAAAPVAPVAAPEAYQPQRPHPRPHPRTNNGHQGQGRQGSRRPNKKNKYHFTPNPNGRRPFHRGQGANYSIPPGAQFHKGPIRTRKY